MTMPNAPYPLHYFNLELGPSSTLDSKPMQRTDF